MNDEKPFRIAIVGRALDESELQVRQRMMLEKLAELHPNIETVFINPDDVNAESERESGLVILAIDEISRFPPEAFKEPLTAHCEDRKVKNGKGQRKANKANRWR